MNRVYNMGIVLKILKYFKARGRDSVVGISWPSVRKQARAHNYKITHKHENTYSQSD